MKRILRLVGAGVALLVVLGGAGLAYVTWALPNVGPPPQLTVRADAAQLAHGKYLATHVAVCLDCHSTRDWNRLTAPMIVGTEGKGGEAFRREEGFPGNYYAPNLTPAHLGSWTDGEMYRAITTGVSRDGHALFPVMPYGNYARMDPADIRAIIAYVRSLRPIENNTIPASESDFPFNFILNTIPQKPQPTVRPDPANVVAYGQYLTTFAGCGDCHTPVDGRGEPLPGKHMAGGREFPMPTGTVRSANLTPSQSGLGQCSDEAFVAKFKHFAADTMPTVGEGSYNSIMPWTMYAGMTEQDLRAIYTYLKTLKPVEQTVVKFTPKNRLVAGR